MPDAKAPNAFPLVESVVPVHGDFALIEFVNRYRSKTSGYHAERTSVLSILDKAGRPVALRWQRDWTEIAPGIEIRKEDVNKRTWTGSQIYESANTGSVRIHRHACPVCVEVVKTWEYNDYDVPKFSTSHSMKYWVRYEVQPGADSGPSDAG
jgi:hypothetical protein